MQKGLHVYPCVRILVGFKEVNICEVPVQVNKWKFKRSGLKQYIQLILNNDKIKFIMKSSFFLLIFQFTCLTLLFAANSMGQGLNQKIDLKLQNETVKKSLQAIQAKSDIRFSISDRGVNENTKLVTITATQMTVKDLLTHILANTHLDYRIVNGIVAIYTKTVPPKPGVIEGTVYDAKTKETLIGALITIQGKSYSTDSKGHYSITLQPGIYDLEIRYIGYEPKKILSVTVKESTTVSLNILLSSSSTSLNEVTVIARRRTNTNVSVLEERKASSIVQDAISAQQIERTASITATQALQRISGVTVTDDKYVAVRGLGDRSVIGQLNGVRLASSDPDRSAVPLDLVPASLLDNITVYKTMTPDLPADASGGIVELKTKSIPESQTLSITFQQGSNSNIGLGGKINAFYNSDMGFWGQKINQKNLSSDFLNLGKQYPGGLAQIQKVIAGANNNSERLAEVSRINQIMDQFDPVLTTRYKQAQLNGIYGITYGNSFKMFKKHQLGVIISASYYNRSTDIVNGSVNQYSIYEGVITGSPYIHQSRNIPSYITPNTPNLGRYLGYKENTGTQTLNYGLLTGLSYRFNKNHEISLQYLSSRGGETQATSLMGQYEYTAGFSGPISNTIYSLKQTYRVFNTFNLQGEHRFSSGEYAPRLSYNLASSNSNHNNPDYRFVNIAEYRPKEGGFYPIPGGDLEYLGTPAHYSLVSGYVRGYGPYGLIQADPNGRRFRNLDENNYNYKTDLNIPFKVLGNRQIFKTGVNYLFRDRDFSEYVLSLPGSNFSSNKQYPLYQVNGNLDQLVSHSNIGVRVVNPSTGEGAPFVNGFLYNNLKSPNNYTGFYETNAFYGMIDFKFTDKLRLTGGVRFEKTDIQSKVDTSGVFIDPAIAASGTNTIYVNPVTKYHVNYKPFYSANLTYAFNKNMNFRLAYNTTLARPEIREMTNVFEFDPFLQALVVGNPELKNQNTRAFDFRWEWFPKRGEVIAVSLFEKQIYNQLERVFILNTTGTGATFPEFPTIAYQNNPNTGQVWGIEMEVVKDLGLLYDPLKNIFIGANLSLVQSDVVKTRERLEAARVIDRQSPRNSPLFEQAPYSLNAYVNYTIPRYGTDLTLSFNVVGERLIRINMDGTPDLYSNPAPVLDMVFSQKLTPKLLLKGYIKNLLNPAYEESYNNPGTGGTFYGTRYIRRSFTNGTDWMIGLTYNF